ncbi:MAG: DUF1003 domain-containing protein [Rhodanobacter sp.]
MSTSPTSSDTPPQAANGAKLHALRFLKPHTHLTSAFGSGAFGQKAESFARYFGTPQFLLTQTAIVVVWIVLNMAGVAHFDIYPFILLNLAFSLQAAYAAPLILLAQTRQADRDKALAEADAQHREALARAAEERQQHLAEQDAQVLVLLQQNTELTKLTHQLSQRIETLTAAVHQHLVGGEAS